MDERSRSDETANGQKLTLTIAAFGKRKELKGPDHHNLKWSGDIPKWLIIRNVFAGGGGGDAVAS
ncbi:hypothetical protein EMIT0P265_10208 [Pseudomonas zeae]